MLKGSEWIVRENNARKMWCRLKKKKCALLKKDETDIING